MNIADTLQGLLRRWYIVLPGIILAMIAGIGAYVAVQPGYERMATQLLLPGEGTVPTGATNPYLYLGGLTQAADIVVGVMGSDEAVGKVVSEYPGTEVLVRRDPTVSGPVIQIVVTATSDAAAEGSLLALIEESEAVLDRLQAEQNVDADDEMRLSTLVQDTTSALQQKARIVLSMGTAFGLVVLTLLVASLVDGLSRRARRSGLQGRAKTTTDALADDVDATATRNEVSAFDGLLMHDFFSPGDHERALNDVEPVGNDVEQAVNDVEPVGNDVEQAVNDVEAPANDDEAAAIEDAQPDRETLAIGAPTARGRGRRRPSSQSS